jgi:uncharacterized protein
LRFTRNTALLYFFALAFVSFTVLSRAQQPSDSTTPPVPHVKQIRLKHILVIGETKGWEHDSVPDTMAAIYKMGHDSGLWDTTLRTDTELITKKDLGRYQLQVARVWRDDRRLVRSASVEHL